MVSLISINNVNDNHDIYHLQSCNTFYQIALLVIWLIIGHSFSNHRAGETFSVRSTLTIFVVCTLSIPFTSDNIHACGPRAGQHWSRFTIMVHTIGVFLGSWVLRFLRWWILALLVSWYLDSFVLRFLCFSVLLFWLSLIPEFLNSWVSQLLSSYILQFFHSLILEIFYPWILQF